MNYNFEIDSYCDNCPEFEVSVREEEFVEDDFCRSYNHYILRSITCKHRKRCTNMVNWLIKKVKENSNDDSKQN